ncbi:scp-like extracellular protein [Niveomyces insectorum RCEF 264]|uniref:Scp-like extracellular protein n=1 Tax=Niveomyces insectorum RCEF 264 TaxID=1081102 RepID=A0A162KBW3_9HYPO|nr:scp-like extracellular protein [Niveomyces insectorum RCEF 264]
MKVSIASVLLSTSLLAAASPISLVLSPRTTAKTTTNVATALPTDYAATALNQHNIHRANHSAPAATWNADLASYAAQAAESCVFAHNLKPGASTGSYGQNIAVYGATGNVQALSPDKMISQAVTNQWYNNEINKFPAAGYGMATPDMTNFNSWGHFSQIVWVASNQVGCATQFCPAGTIFSNMGSWFSVCNYRAQGNMAGQYGNNIRAPLGKPTVVA